MPYEINHILWDNLFCSIGNPPQSTFFIPSGPIVLGFTISTFGMEHLLYFFWHIDTPYCPISLIWELLFLDADRTCATYLLFLIFFYNFNISINLEHFVENQVFSLETAFNAIFFYKSHFWKPTLKSYFLFSKSGFLSGFLRKPTSQKPT